MKLWKLGMVDAARRAFRAPDGATWTAEVRTPGSTNVIVVFLHADRAARQDRYATWVMPDPGAGAKGAKERLSSETVLKGLDEREMLRLWRRSVPVDSSVPRFEPG